MHTIIDLSGPPGGDSPPAGAPTAVPHDGQKRAPAASSVPHDVQWAVAAASGVPHEAQNLAPAGFSAWQLAHAAAGGARDGAARGAELGAGRVAGVAVGALDAGCRGGREAGAAASEARPGRRGRSSRGGRRSLTAEPRPAAEEGAPDAGAALGHALAGTEGHLAGGVLLEAAGQTGVGGVLGEGLELRLVLLGQVDVEVAHADDGDAVAGELLVALGHHLFFDVGGVGREAEDRPAVAHDLRRHVGAHDLQELVAHPARDRLVVGDVDGADQVGDQGNGILDLHGVVAEHPQRHDHPGLGILHVIDAAAERVAGVLARAHEVQLRPVGVAAGGPVDDDAQSGDLVGVDLMAAWPHGGDHLTGVDEHGQLVGVDDGAGVLADVDDPAT